MLEMLVYSKCNLKLFKKQFNFFGIIENGQYFCKIFRSQTLNFKICRSRKSYRVSALTFVVSTTSWCKIIAQHWKNFIKNLYPIKIVVRNNNKFFNKLFSVIEM